MSTQPEALLLAECLEQHEYCTLGQMDRAAAELRRLHAEHTEDQTVIAVWRGRTLRAEQQRAELLEALERIADPRNIHFAGDAQVVARAAIARAEGEKT